MEKNRFISVGAWACLVAGAPACGGASGQGHADASVDSSLFDAGTDAGAVHDSHHNQHQLHHAAQPDAGGTGGDAGTPASTDSLTGLVHDAYELSFHVHELAAQGDAVLVVGSNGYPAVARFTDKGRLDKTFGIDGIATLPRQPIDVPAGATFADVGEEAFTVAVTDDALYLGGQVNGQKANGAALVVAKFTPDGDIVKSFGKDGVWFHSIGSGNTAAVEKLFPLADGGLLVLSSVVEKDYPEWSVFKLKQDGTPEVPIANDMPPPGLGVGNTVSNAILVGDSVLLGDGSYEVGKVLTAGGFDTSFGANGNGLVSINHSDNSWTTNLLRRPSGEIVMVGSCPGGIMDPATDSALRIVQLRADGTVDTGFADQGQTVLEHGADGENPVGSALLPDGRIIVFMEGALGGTALMMIKPDGSLDPKFGKGGVLEDDALGHHFFALFASGPLGRRLLLREGEVWLAGRTDTANPSDPSRLWLYRQPL